MKQRLLVMNGQKIVETEKEGKWVTNSVKGAGMLKPGIYSLYLSVQADKTKSYDGVILHADENSLYQQVGKNFVKHDRNSFEKLPEIGSISDIKYDGNKAIVMASLIKKARKLSL